MANWNFGQEDFDRLLSWLDPDRRLAGERYESIRRKLILIFASRGAPFPEELTDECINRVIQKLPEILEKYIGNPENYFYGVARIIILEWPRKHRPIVLPPPHENSPELEHHLNCLDECLAKLPDSSRKLILSYYQEEKQAKIDSHAELANRLGIAVNALRIRAHRVRRGLERCVIECTGEHALA